MMNLPKNEVSVVELLTSRARYCDASTNKFRRNAGPLRAIRGFFDNFWGRGSVRGAAIIRLPTVV